MSGKTHVFTSAAWNYLPKARMLFNSLRRHHPEFVLHLALADTLDPAIDIAGEPFDHVAALADLNIPEWRGWSFCHSIVELSTAIKPFMLSSLLQREDCARVIFLDPDIVVFSRLDDILAALDDANLVLTPHQIKPEKTLAAIMDNEICSLKHGIYNLGFIGVAAGEVGREFAAWWSRRTYHFCRADIPNGLFTDQRWIDLVPAFFPGVAIMRSSRHNVAPWNLTTRKIELAPDGGYAVDGEPLGFYHFTGFDSGAHATMARKNSADDKVVLQLVDWYQGETRRGDQDPAARVEWAFARFSDGAPISRAQRMVYRNRIDLQRAFPDPFAAEGYAAWWTGQGRIEYPALFDITTEDQETVRLASVLTPGFLGNREDTGWAATGVRLARMIARPAEGLRVAKRGWEILRNEGLPGLRRRIKG